MNCNLKRIVKTVANWNIKKAGQMSLIALALFSLVACGGIPTDVTEGLTSSMASNQAASSEQPDDLPYLELKATQCEGTMDPESNMIQVAFELTSDAKDLEIGDKQNLLIGGGTGLLTQIGKVEAGTYTLTCNGEAEMVAMPLKSKDETVSWLAGLKIPELSLISPSGEKTALKDVLLHGLTASSEDELPFILEAIYGVSFKDGYQSFFATQKLLVENYPAEEFIEERALNNGMSKENMSRFLALSSEEDVEKQRGLLLDIVTTENKAYVETVVGTTVKSLLAVGASPKEISDLFFEETNGRITIQFANDSVASVADLTVTMMKQDDDGNVTVAASEDSSGDGGAGDGEAPDDGGDTGDGGDSGDDGGAGNGEAPDDGGDSGDGGDDDGGGRTWGGFFRDLLWNMFMGGAAGTALGAEFAGVGAVPGAAGGAIAGGVYTIAGGFYDPFPDDPNSPCNSPLYNC